MAKKLFLTVYNYGMGGTWLIFSAHSEKQIIDKYPQFKVISPRPDWMSDFEYLDILENWFIPWLGKYW
jgi:transposase InsO family protein